MVFKVYLNYKMIEPPYIDVFSNSLSISLHFIIELIVWLISKWSFAIDRCLTVLFFKACFIKYFLIYFFLSNHEFSSSQ